MNYTRKSAPPYRLHNTMTECTSDLAASRRVLTETTMLHASSRLTSLESLSNACYREFEATQALNLPTHHGTGCTCMYTATHTQIGFCCRASFIAHRK